MKELSSVVAQLQDHFTKSINSEVLYRDSFTRLVVSGLVLHHSGTT